MRTTKVGDICNLCGKPWLPAVGGSVYHDCYPRPQFHCSNPDGICDRCGQKFSSHETGNYFCPREE